MSNPSPNGIGIGIDLSAMRQQQASQQAQIHLLHTEITREIYQALATWEIQREIVGRAAASDPLGLNDLPGREDEPQDGQFALTMPNLPVMAKAAVLAADVFLTVACGLRLERRPS